ncbi:MAG: YkvA family protein [Acidimicrobiia bacterium]
MRFVVDGVVALVACWAILVLAVVAARPRGLRAADVAFLMPDLVLLVGGLARDRSIPRRVRARIWILLAWMASPIDLIPDVIPIVGVAYDVILSYFVLRSVARVAGNGALTRHWRGGPDGLAALEHLLRLDDNQGRRLRQNGASGIVDQAPGRRRDARPGHEDH